jgi:hypothetical protein
MSEAKGHRRPADHDHELRTDFGSTVSITKRGLGRGCGSGRSKGLLPGVEKAPRGTRLRPPALSGSPVASAAEEEGERTKGSQRFGHRDGLPARGKDRGRSEAGFGSQKSVLRYGITGLGARRVWTLEGKQSPWKERVAGRWQRRLVTTDSSAEQSLEVGCFVRFRRAPTPAHLGGCGRSAKGIAGFGP